MGATSETETSGASATASTTGSGTDTEADTEADTETTTETGTGGEASGRGLPEGVSNWTGEAEINGLTVLVDAGITNTAGDLVATVTLKDDPDNPAGIGAGQYRLTGTHEPSAGLIALAPDDWIMTPDVTIELVGVSAAYDPEAKVISGMLVDYAAGDDNTLAGGPLTIELVDGDGEPTVVGDEAAALADGSQVFVGSMSCTGAARDSETTLVYDGAGGVSGELRLGDPDFVSPLGTFAVTGVHNPSTGGLTLIPGLWLESFDSKLTFFIDGTFDAGSGAFNGDVRTNTSACPPATWESARQ